MKLIRKFLDIIRMLRVGIKTVKELRDKLDII